MPQTCQPGRALRQIACRSARAVWIADGLGERERVAGDGTAVVVEDDGQPRLSRLPSPVFQPDVELRMVGLPDGVGAGRLVTVDQVEGFGIGLRPLMGQGHQGRVQVADQTVRRSVARRSFAELLGEGDGLAMDGGRGERAASSGPGPRWPVGACRRWIASRDRSAACDQSGQSVAAKAVYPSSGGA